MPIWSLTKERVEKLLKQIGEKEEEIDALIKTTEKDLWRRDLDEFIQEWRFQLEDEKKREKKVQSLGRRTSSKVKTHLKQTGKKRKNEDSDFESDTNKKSKKAAKPQLNGLLAPVEPMLPKSQTSKPLTNGSIEKSGLSKTTSADKPDIWMTLDGASSEVEAPVAAKSKLTASKKSTTKPIKVAVNTEDGPHHTAPVSRAPARAAARKPVKYNLNSDSNSDSDGEDMLFDVGKMVKGIDTPAAADTTATTRPLFSSTAALSRPSSSAGLAARKSFGRDRTVLDVESADETDYVRLARPSTYTGQGSTSKPVAVDDGLEDDGDSELLPSKTLLAAKAARKPAARAKPVATTTLKASKKTASGPAVKPLAKKQTIIPPASVPDDDELLDDDDDDEVVAAPTRAAARPARRAAAAPKKWIEHDEDDDDDGSEEDEADFDDDDSE